MSNVNALMDGDIGQRFASAVIAANATTAMDFGTPNDIDLRTTDFKPGTRVLLALSASRASGTTSSLTFTIQDADDNAGSIGTPATATIGGTIPSVAAAGGLFCEGIVSVKVKPDRPWIRVNMVHGTAGTDSFTCHAHVLGIPNGV